METVTLALLGDMPNTLPSPILEVGCGDGELLRSLSAQFSGKQLIGVDLHPAPPSTRIPLVQANGQQLPYADSTVGALLAMDVFDQHGVDLTTALAESRRVLIPGGLLLLRVSAHPRLYGPHDFAFNTGHRYGRDELLHALLAADFRVERWTFANTLLTPLLMPQRLLQRWGVVPWQPAVYRAGWSNRLVAAALKAEARWLTRRNLPFGLSLIAAARKPEE